MFVTSTDNHHLHSPQRESYNGIMEASSTKAGKVENIEKVLIKKRGCMIEKNNPSINEKIITDVHTQEYVNYLKSRTKNLEEGEDSILNDVPYIQIHQEPINESAKKGYYASDTYTSFTKHIRQVVKSSYEAVHHAGTHVMNTGGYAYALTRPPGHHAMPGKASGYCYLANGSIFANFAKKQGKKVGILDIDFHHGNGAQEIFFEDDQVITTSIHADPARKFPYYTGFAHEIGRGKGKNKNLNIPLGKGVTIPEYISYLDTAISFLQHENVDLLIIALGFDTYIHDPICDFSLLAEDFKLIGKKIKDIGIPTLFVQEGGYAIDDIGLCAEYFFSSYY